MARSGYVERYDDPLNQKWEPGDVGQNPNEDFDLEAIRRLFGVPSQIENQRRNTPPPVDEKNRKFAPPDPDDFPQAGYSDEDLARVKKLAGDIPTDKEGYDEWRRERTFNRISAEDQKYHGHIEILARRPEWHKFLEELGEGRAEMLDDRTLILAFQEWDRVRKDEKPSWLDEDETPSDTKSLNEQYPPDDRNDAMGPAPRGNFSKRLRAGGQS